MSTEAMPSEPTDFYRWIRATTLGWLLGFVSVVVLSIALDQIGGTAQFIVGVGMGAGVGFMQARVVGEWVKPTRRWIWVTTVGMGLPFLLWDLGVAVGLQASFSLPLCVVAGSLLVGVLQSILLRLRLKGTVWWIPASLVGWGLPAAGITLGDSGLLSGPGALVSVGAMLLGGAVLGAVTGKALLWLPQRSVHRIHFGSNPKLPSLPQG
jgi:hypothetical protein